MLKFNRFLDLVSTLPRIIQPIVLGFVACVAALLFILGLALPLLVTIAIIWGAVSILG